MPNNSMFLMLCLFLVPISAPSQDTNPVSDSLLPTGRGITPIGKMISFYGRPVDMDIHQGILFIKNHKQLLAIDAETMKRVASIDIVDGASLYGLAIDQEGRIFVSNTKNKVFVYRLQDNSLKVDRTISLPADSFPCGIDFDKNQTKLFVCLSKKNSVAIVDLKTDEILQIEVGVGPFDCKRSGNLLVVSNLGGRRATNDDKTSPSAGTKTIVDVRGIANEGSICVIDLSKNEVIRQLKSGRLPTVIDSDGTQSFVCNSNEDTISILDKNHESIQSQNVKPKENLPFGSMPNCVRLKSKQVLIALAGNNAVGLYDRTDSGQLRLKGLIPTAWYPGALAFNKKYLFIGSTKGFGARANRRPKEKGMNSHDHHGTVQRINWSDIQNEKTMEQWTKQVADNSRFAQILRNQLLDNSDSPQAPKPIPDKLGQPSLFKHVIYVIKENRTFDQVFGDYDNARSDKNLCIFPRERTPNHHALADRFGILDNYYCNGVLSADGHSWATEGNVTPYLERAFGGFSRSYTFGDDPLTYSSSGFIWDHILAAGLSFRNYGEMNYSKPPNGMNYHQIFAKFQNGEDIKFDHSIGIERLKKYSCMNYPGWNMEIPDVLRMDRFLKEFHQFNLDESLPNFCIVYLPEDHLGAKNVTSNAHMADNDLALGQLVEAVSKSRYWKDTVIFVNEDDPQNGFDHIDGHRSICLVISAYSKPGINHHFYNQTSVIRTMLHIFGIPPMNQQDASSPLMKECFVSTADLSEYAAITPKTKLDEQPAKQTSWSDSERKWRQILATVPIERTGMKSEKDEDNLNRFIWHEAKGWKTPYPEKFTGAHATGLKRLRLSLDPDFDD